jgi:cytochrome c biogenesis protein CcdA
MATDLTLPGDLTAPPRGIRWGLLALAAGAAAMLALFAGGLVLIPRYRAAHPMSALQRSDADRAAIDDMYLDLTLATPGFMQTRRLERYLGDRAPGTVLPVLVGVNTHTGSIEHMHHLHGNFFLIGPDGHRHPALTSPIVLSQHHNAYMVLFPARDDAGERFLDRTSGTIAVEAVGVGARQVRRFAWELPIVDDPLETAEHHGLATTLMLGVALLGALLVVLSPCALELTLYYSAIISCTVAESARAASAAAPGQAVRLGRRRLLANLGSFVAGFTLLYCASGATVGLIGEGVRRPLGDYGGAIQLVGGGLILFFALRVLDVNRALVRGWERASGTVPSLARVGRAWDRVMAHPRRTVARLRLGARRNASDGRSMRPIDSFLVGIGLSTSCLTCMGGAVLYPLLVYAGITSWYWGLVTLGLYSLGIALPMVLISLGFFQVRLSLESRLGVNRVLRAVSGTVLAAIALLILTGRERIVTDLTFRFLGGVFRWLA